MGLPHGFLFGAATAGIKASGKPDLALALVPAGGTAAAMFTRNLMVAAPVAIGREHLRYSRGRLNAVIVNAGNANCATGKHGLLAARDVCRELARQISAPPARIFPSSTGIIGVPLPVDKITSALPRLIPGTTATPEAFESFATAILTTDTRKKIAAESISHKDRTVTLLGAAKGAGMIHPNMATMLVYIFTDVAASPGELHSLLKDAVDESFNNISVDGDTSTNDTVLLLASGKSGVKLRDIRKNFSAALNTLCQSLAQQIIADGEGVQHIVRLRMEEAASAGQARQVARTIATSALVKTAWAGADPNWGRILAAIGRSGAGVRPHKVSIYLGDMQICRNGAAAPFDHDAAHRYMSQPQYDIRITLGAGRHQLDFLSCDLTAEYVHINADYST